MFRTLGVDLCRRVNHYPTPTPRQSIIDLAETIVFMNYLTKIFFPFFIIINIFYFHFFCTSVPTIRCALFPRYYFCIQTQWSSPIFVWTLLQMSNARAALKSGETCDSCSRRRRNKFNIPKRQFDCHYFHFIIITLL